VYRGWVEHLKDNVNRLRISREKKKGQVRGGGISGELRLLEHNADGIGNPEVDTKMQLNLIRAADLTT